MFKEKFINSQKVASFLKLDFMVNFDLTNLGRLQNKWFNCDKFKSRGLHEKQAAATWNLESFSEFP
jgi:hypothetical protein